MHHSLTPHLRYGRKSKHTAALACSREIELGFVAGSKCGANPRRHHNRKDQHEDLHTDPPLPCGQQVEDLLTAVEDVVLVLLARRRDVLRDGHAEDLVPTNLWRDIVAVLLVPVVRVLVDIEQLLVVQI